MTATDETASHCPTCGAEYRAGFDVCADDGTRLVPGAAARSDAASSEARPPNPPPAGPPVQWVEVETFHREEEARLLSGRLQAEGIDARVYPEFQGGYYGESVTIPVQVLVPQHREVEARLVIERLRQT